MFTHTTCTKRLWDKLEGCKEGYSYISQGTSGFIQFSSVQSLSCDRLFVTPWTAGGQASLSIINCQSLLKLMSIQSVMTSNHLVLCCPPQSFPVSGSLLVCQSFTSGGQSIGSFSFSVSPSNEYSGLISFRMDW